MTGLAGRMEEGGRPNTSRHVQRLHPLQGELECQLRILAFASLGFREIQGRTKQIG